MTPQKIIWRGWAAWYSPEERKLMPKSLREAEFIHELKARFDGTLSEGDRTDDRFDGKSLNTGQAQARSSLPVAPPELYDPSPSENVLFPIPERVRLELDLRKDAA